MAGGGALAALIVRVGADTSDFQGKTREAGTALGALGDAAARAGAVLNNELVAPLAVSGNIARQFAGHVSGAAAEAVKAIGGVSEGAQAGASALGGLADTGLAAAGAFSVLGNQAISFTKMSPASVAAIAQLVEEAWKFGKSIGDLGVQYAHLGELTTNAVKGPLAEFGQILADDRAQFEQALPAYEALRKALGASGAEWAVSTEWTKENAHRLADLTEQLQAVARAQREAKVAGQEHVSALDEQARVATGTMLAYAGYLGQLRSEYDVLSQHEVEGHMRRMVADFESLSREAVSADQLMAAFTPKVADLEEHAAGYVNLAIPKHFNDLTEAIKSGSVDAVAQLSAKFLKLPADASSGADASKTALDGIGQDLAGSISGGFGRGMADGTNVARQQLSAWRAELASTPVEVRFKLNPASLAGQLRELGIDVPTPGGVPS